VNFVFLLLFAEAPMSSIAIRSLLILSLMPLLASAQGEVPGISKTKPASGRYVETPQGYMVPYEAKIPGTDVTYTMQPIPGGKVKVGSPATEAGRQDDEGPQFEVTIEPFWIAEHEVTWAEYKQYMAMHDQFKKLYETKLRESPDPKREDIVTAPSNLYDPTFTFKQGADPQQPAVTMSQFAAKQYTKWLSGISGQFLRLPSEAEWEYACRAGASTAFHFGDDPKQLGDYAWFYDNSGETTHKVAEKKPNAWGLYDMHGNVGEWVIDEYVADGYQAHAGKVQTVPGAIAWPKKLYPRIVKGGGWDDDAAQCRTAFRQQSDDDSWRGEDPNFPQSPWWFTSEPALSVGMRLIRPLHAPATAAERNKYWDADIQQIRDDVMQRIDKEGRGARGVADPQLPADLKKLEPPK
jgi:formylglycine-generating enzyme required for sulfatase activity